MTSYADRVFHLTIKAFTFLMGLSIVDYGLLYTPH